MSNQDRKVTLEIDGPTAVCGSCGFTSALTGAWSIEAGRLVFRADTDPLTRRGPSLHYCGEGREVTEFAHLVIDGEDMPDEDFATLRATAETGVPHEEGIQAAETVVREVSALSDHETATYYAWQVGRMLGLKDAEIEALLPDETAQ
jgi:hypothetical protein